MKSSKLHLVILPLLVIGAVSCLGTQSNDVVLASNAYFVSLTFEENDSIPGLEDAVFTLEADPDYSDSVIVNLDSLPYLTALDSIFATFIFQSTSGSRLIQDLGNGEYDTIYFVSADTIDFTYPTKVENTSADGSMTVTYQIKVNVHQVDPELYVWNQVNEAIANSPEVNQKGIYFKTQEKFLFYTGTDTETSVYTSTDKGATWSSAALIDMPAENDASLKLRYMTEHDGMLFVTDNDGKLYRSADGTTWQTAFVDNDYVIYNLLFSSEENLWAIMRTSVGDYRLGVSVDGTAWTDKVALPQYWNDASRMFPIDDYAALVFKSKVGNPKMMVLGGLNQSGLRNNTTWLSENGSSWEAIDDGALQTLQGAALVQYDDKILLFGGMASTGSIVSLLETENEGISWAVPDTACNVLPEDFTVRAYQSLLLDEEDKCFYLIGGRNNVRAFSDVWHVKLNRMWFD